MAINPTSRMMRRRMPGLLGGFLTLLTCCLRPAAGAEPLAVSDAPEQVLGIPVTDDAGANVQMVTRLCRPSGSGPAHLVVINHGTPGDSQSAALMRVAGCGHEAVQWFLQRGFVVALPLRRGYGATGGRLEEGNGRCDHPDFVHSGLETARDIDAAVSTLTRLPFVRPDGVVVVGQSAGGWGTIAYASQAPARVAAFIVMAGGRGGHRDGLPNNNCRPDLLADAARQFARGASTRMLWIYTANDSYFAPPIAEAMQHSYTAAGGLVDLMELPPFGDDGHHLFFGRGGSAIWGPPVERYLAQQLGSR